MSPRGAEGGPELTPPPHARVPSHGSGSPRHSSPMPDATPALSPAGQEWPIAASSCRYRVQGRGLGRAERGHPDIGFVGRAHVVHCPFPSRILSHSCWGGLGRDGAKQDQSENNLRASCSRAEPPLAARRECPNPARVWGPDFSPQCPLSWRALRAVRSRWCLRAPMSL